MGKALMADRLTYRGLLRILQAKEKQEDTSLDDTVTVCVDGEYFTAELLEFEGDDILDDGRLVIVTQDWNEGNEDDKGCVLAG